MIKNTLLNYEELLPILTDFIDSISTSKKKYPEVDFFFDNKDNNPKFRSELYKTLFNFTTLQEVKETSIDNIELEDIVLYSYLYAFSHNNDTNNECLNWYVNAARKKKYYYVDKTESVKNYVEKNWSVLKLSFESKESAISVITEKITIKWGVAVINTRGYLPLISYPLIETVTVSKKIDFLIHDIGILFFSYLIKNANVLDKIYIPSPLIEDGLLGLNNKKIEAKAVFDSEKNQIQYTNEKYKTIYQTIENELSVTIEKKVFPNMKTDDFSCYFTIFSIIYLMKDRNYFKKTVGELADIVLANKPEYQNKSKRHRCIVEMLGSLKKFDQYRMKYSDLFDPINWLHIKITQGPSDTEETSLRVNFQPVYFADVKSVGYDDFIDFYKKIPLKELEKYEIEIEIPQILLNDLQNIILDNEKKAVIEKLHSSNAQWLYGYYYRLKQKHPANETIIMSYKDLKKSIVIETRKVKAIKIINDILEEIKQAGGFKDYYYNNEISAYYITSNTTIRK